MTSVSLNPRTEGFPILEVIRWTGGITARLILMLEELSEKIEVTCLELLFFEHKVQSSLGHAFVLISEDSVKTLKMTWVDCRGVFRCEKLISAGWLARVGVPSIRHRHNTFHSATFHHDLMVLMNA